MTHTQTVKEPKKHMSLSLRALARGTGKRGHVRQNVIPWLR
jgi:hypothetical protein